MRQLSFDQKRYRSRVKKGKWACKGLEEEALQAMLAPCKGRQHTSSLFETVNDDFKS
jgi:hypothetical protein